MHCRAAVGRLIENPMLDSSGLEVCGVVKYEVWRFRKGCGVVKYKVWRLRRACEVVKYEVWRLRKACGVVKYKSGGSGRLAEV